MPTPRQVGGHRTWARTRRPNPRHYDLALTNYLDLTQPANLRALTDNGAARLIACPDCQAQPTDFCTTSTGTRRSRPHPARRHQGRREAERRAQALEAQQ